MAKSSVVISDDPRLLDCEYEFLDLYCTDKKCDCRKAMFNVYHNGQLVSVVNYGWENEAYYRKWMRCERGALAKEQPKPAWHD